MSRRTQAALAMMATTAMWGATFVLVKQALESASVFAFMVLRFGLAALVMAAIYRAAVRGMSRSELRAGVEIGLFLFAGYAFQNAGLLFTTASKSAFITGSAVVLVPLLLFAFWGRKARTSAWVGAFAAFAGLFFITVPGGAGLSGFAQLNRGDMLTVAGAISFALHIIFIGRYTSAHVAGDVAPRMSIGALSFVQVAVTALLSVVAIPLFHFAEWEATRLDWNPQLITAVAVTGILGTALAFSVQVWAQRYLAPSHTGLLLTLEPVFAALTSYLWLDERLGGRALFGSCLILIGILIAELKGPAQAAADSPGPVRQVE